MPLYFEDKTDGFCCGSDLLKNKSQPEAAANEVEAWVVSEREMKERLQREKEARELKEQVDVSYYSCDGDDRPD